MVGWNLGWSSPECDVHPIRHTSSVPVAHDDKHGERTPKSPTSTPIPNQLISPEPGWTYRSTAIEPMSRQIRVYLPHTHQSTFLPQAIASPTSSVFIASQPINLSPPHQHHTSS